MRSTFVTVVAAGVLLTMNQPAHSVYSISNPVANGPYAYNYKLATDGARNMGAGYRVRLWLNGTNCADSNNIAGGGMATTWQYDFPAPSNNWTVSNDWKCKLYDATGFEQDSEDFRFVVP